MVVYNGKNKTLELNSGEVLEDIDVGDILSPLDVAIILGYEAGLRDDTRQLRGILAAYQKHRLLEENK